MKGLNMIDWVKSSPEALWESTNHTRIHKKGFEANMQFDLREWLGANQPFTAFKTGYLYLQQERVDDNLISNYTLNHLRHKFTASLNHRLTGNLSLMAFSLAGTCGQLYNISTGNRVNWWNTSHIQSST